MDVDDLIRALYNEPDLDKRKYIPDKLAKLGDWKSTKPLGELIIDLDQPLTMRAEAVESLGKQGDPAAVRYLIEVLNDESQDVRRTAVWSLGQIGTPDTVEPIFSMKGDDNLDVRRWVAKAAGRVRSKEVSRHLLQYYHEIEPLEDQKVVADILRAAKDQSKRSSDEILHEWEENCSHLLVVDELRTYVKQAAMILLNKCYRRGVRADAEFLEKILHSTDPSDPLLRPVLLLGLGHAGSISLLRQLDDPFAIKGLGIAADIDYLTDQLANNPTPKLLVPLLEAFGYTEYLPDVRELLTHDDLTVRLQAMELYAKHERQFDTVKAQYERREGTYKLLEMFRYYGSRSLDIFEHSALEMDKVARQNTVYSLISDEILQHKDEHSRIYAILEQVDQNDTIWHIRRDARIGMERIKNWDQ